VGPHHRSPTVVVIVASGVDLDHPELQPLLVAGQDLVDLEPDPATPAGWVFEGDFMGNDNLPQGRLHQLDGGGPPESYQTAGSRAETVTSL
jgi:hypothetical protein